MRALIVYPIPFNLWQEFKPKVRRFAKTFRHFAPEHDYELYVTCHWGEPIPKVHEMFYGIKTRFQPFYADGCDIGATQAVAQMFEERFIVGFATHAYFHRPGWLKRLVEARIKHGPGLYGASGSFERFQHIRTTCYGMDSELWKAYPKRIETRQDCSDAESGTASLTAFIQKQNLPVMQVTWDGEQKLEDSRKVPGIFRNGQQNAMLAWDRHCDIFFSASSEEQNRLESLANGA